MKEKTTQAVIMAAGLGTRMRPLTNGTPKGMLLIKGRPLLEWTFDFLPEEISEVIITVNHLGDKIKNHFGAEWKGRKIKYVFQKELNGTGGAVHACREYLKDRFIVINGDDLFYKKDLENLCGEELAALAIEVEDPRKYGVFMTDGKGNITGSIEKPDTDKFKQIAIGAYALNKKFFDYELVPIVKQELGLPQTLASMGKDFKVKMIMATHWFPVGCPDDLEKAQMEIEKFIQ